MVNWVLAHPGCLGIMLRHQGNRFDEFQYLHKLNLPGPAEYSQLGAAFGDPDPENESPVKLVKKKKLAKEKRVLWRHLRRDDGLHESEYPGPGKYLPDLIESVRAHSV